MPDAETLELTGVARRPLVDRSGERVGRLQDLIVRIGQRAHPPVTGVVARIGGRELFVPIDRVALAHGGSRLEGDTVNLLRFERRPGELLLTSDVLGHHVINVDGARLVRAKEIEISREDGTWHVTGIEPHRPRLVGRLFGPRRPGRAAAEPPEGVVDWENVEPFVGHVPSSRLRLPYRKLARLHPAQIADLVEAASHEEGEEIIQAVRVDRELEADVFEELDPEHQLEFIASRSDEEAARLLASMAPDDAADLITDLDQERRKPLLALLPSAQQRKIRSLLSYNSETAGGLMSPDFLSLPGDTPVTDVIEKVRSSRVAPEALQTVFVAGTRGELAGAVSIVGLLHAAPSAPLADVSNPCAHVGPGADLHSILRKMADFNLTVVPVVDEDHRQIGVVTVDDLLELLLPTGWRKEFGMASAET